SNAKLPDHLLYFRVVGFGRPQLQRVGLLEQDEVLEAHGSFASVIEAGREAGARVIGIGAGHTRGQRRSGLRSKRLFFLFALFLLVGVGLRGVRFGLVLLGRRRSRLLRPQPDSLHAEKQKRGSHRGTNQKAGESVHRFSSVDFFSNMPCIILISARCVLSASVAKLNRSASWPAPAVSNKSFTMVNAP